MFIAIAAQVVFSDDAECRPKSVDHSIEDSILGANKVKEQIQKYSHSRVTVTVTVTVGAISV